MDRTTEFPEDALDARTREQLRLLVDRDMELVVRVLAGADDALDVEEVATRFVSRRVTASSTAEYERTVERVAISLHHEWLPKLADAGLVDYDSASNTAAYSAAGPPAIDWLREMPRALATHVQPSQESPESDVGVLEGRESIVQYGRQLADEAETELFCLYESTDLLEDECVRRARKAIERGVRIYVGSGNSTVRDLVREELEGAILWEPQLDLLAAPSHRRVGRLVMIDRRKVMLGLLDERTADEGVQGETALVGEGEDNPLVVLVRELLGPRLDHLDHQSEDFHTTFVSEP